MNIDDLYKNKKVDRLPRHNAVVRRLFWEIAEIKEAINNEDYEYAQGLFKDLKDDDQSALWVAPSDGGIFTTHERTVLRG